MEYFCCDRNDNRHAFDKAQQISTLFVVERYM